MQDRIFTEKHPTKFEVFSNWIYAEFYTVLTFQNFYTNTYPKNLRLDKFGL